MSYHTLQRLIVRMLFDSSLVVSVYTNPDEALANIDITVGERAQLLAIDRRCWAYDPLRRRRTLRTLVEEFKISSTLALAETRSLAYLENFFSSDLFHQSVAERGSLGFAFARYLADACQAGRLKTTQLPDVLRLETMLAGCRREVSSMGRRHTPTLPSVVSDTAKVRLAAGVNVGRFQANVIKTIQRVEQYLFEVNLMPAMVLCDDAPRLDQLPEVDTHNKVYLFFTPGSNGISLVNIKRADYIVLVEARNPCTIQQLTMRAVASGVNSKKAQEIITEALEQETLVLDKQSS
ncbi:MAG: hypothetical protein AB1489_16815 [Acidobacteriota bacterium]